MNRTDIIQTLISRINAQSYLEIGVSAGDNFRAIMCNKKVGVDPASDSPATLHMTSDKFFENSTEKFDVIFVDGLHHAEQVYKDITNSLDALREGGYIVCHDMNPIEEEHQRIPFQGGHWNGDCWKAFVKLRMERGDLDMCVLDTDEGCAIIKVKDDDQVIEPLENNLELTYTNLVNKREEWLNLMTPKEYFKDEESPLQRLIYQFVETPQDPEVNWQLGLYYESIGQTATAISYYIRTAERAEETLSRYECMMRAGVCFKAQGIRKFSVKGMMQHAIALHPERPEAYWLLGEITSNENNDGSWFESFTWANLGVYAETNNTDLPPLRTNVGYPGIHALRVQQAAAAWWCGLCEEARTIFLELNADPDLPKDLREVVTSNMHQFNAFYTQSIRSYSKEDYNKLKLKFPGAETIERNYAESYQDLFVLSMHNGKRNGTYLEIGAGNAEYGNNTALLEKDFDWTGVSLELNSELSAAFNEQRKNPCVVRDATKINYAAFIPGFFESNTIDYLQIDCDPAETTYKILLSMPFEEYKFGVITYEHDHYATPDDSYREKSRKLLKSYGYLLVVGNISPDEKERPYEDWWVHPELVDPLLLEQLQQTDDNTKMAEDYMLENS